MHDIIEDNRDVTIHTVVPAALRREIRCAAAREDTTMRGVVIRALVAYVEGDRSRERGAQ